MQVRCHPITFTLMQHQADMHRTVEPHLAGRELYTSDATHNELGKEFFSPGSQRVYVRSNPQLPYNAVPR